MLAILVDAAGIITNSLLYTCNFILFSKLHWEICCFSVLMASKLSEMDDAVKKIHSNILQNLEKDQGRTLLVCDYLVHYEIHASCLLWCEHINKN